MKLTLPVLTAVLLLFALDLSAARAGPELQVIGLDTGPLSISGDEWAALPRATVAAQDHNGRQGVFDGVPLRELLARVHAPLGKELRGRNLAVYLLAEGADGYRAVIALPELDAAFTDELVLVADRRDGAALGEGEGPLRLVVPGDRRQARWVRQLVRLRLQTAQ